MEFWNFKIVHHYKLPDQTEVQIRTRIRADSKTHHDQHITVVYNWQMMAVIYDKASSMMQLPSGANVFVPKDDILIM